MPIINANIPTQIDNDLAASTTQGASKTAIAAAIAVVQSDIDTHEALTNNPHATTLAQVLSAGNVMGSGQWIEGFNNPNAYFWFDNGTYAELFVNNGKLYVDANNVTLNNAIAAMGITDAASLLTKYNFIRSTGNHDLKGVDFNLDFTNVKLSNETASLILSTDASKNIKGLPLATYPSLAELAFVKGVTSAIQTQLNAKKGVILSFFPQTRFSPADSATYYFSNSPNPSVQTSEDFGSTVCPKTFTAERIKGVITSGVASGEDVSFYLTIDGVDTLIETVQLTTSRTLITNNAINTVITEDTKVSIKMVTPAWVTNPTNLSGSFNIYGI